MNADLSKNILCGFYPSSLFVCLILLLYLYFYPASNAMLHDFLHPHSISCIHVLISCNLHIPTGILTFPPWFPSFPPPFPPRFLAFFSLPPWFPGIPIPFSILPSFQLPFPRRPFILFPDYPFRLLQIASFCYWHNPIYWFQKIEFIKWIVNASIVKQQYVSSKVLLCQESFFKKYVY